MAMQRAGNSLQWPIREMVLSYRRSLGSLSHCHLLLTGAVVATVKQIALELKSCEASDSLG